MAPFFLPSFYLAPLRGCRGGENVVIKSDNQGLDY